MSAIAVAILGGAAIGGLASWASSKNAQNASRDAAAVQSASALRAAQLEKEASDNAIDAQLEMFYAGVEERKPFITAGGRALSEVQDIIAKGPGERGTFEGSKLESTLERSADRAGQRAASAGGYIGSGRAITEAVDNSVAIQLGGRQQFDAERQNVLREYIDTQINPRLSIAGAAPLSISEQARSTTGANVGNFLIQGGNALGGGQRQSGYATGAGYINAANAYAGGVTGIANSANQGISNFLFAKQIGAI